ncbi:hypothetical protein Ade02nite_40190 [Paractinoplanes deccanensis]|uniref:histidine kinase n=2 Tax=Paractinoplanes deccanensis TaxID=113561 RepID=A0ABQ3Y5X1_9ACTN|nr:hypothetical protein Ade02nite_40190 [Actinoplanes deccanensis]
MINARDAMPGGGEVGAETSAAEITADQGIPVSPGQYARLMVSDTGTGMTAEVRDRLFEPFFTTKPAEQGTGLGLATVYGIVSDAGGHIGVDSAPGRGTTFEILLPLAADPTGSAATTAASGGANHGHGERVAVVEDDDYVRDLVVRILAEDGYRTTALTEDGLDEPALDDVALLITDIVLRGEPGPVVAERCGPGIPASGRSSCPATATPSSARATGSAARSPSCRSPSPLWNCWPRSGRSSHRRRAGARVSGRDAPRLRTLTPGETARIRHDGPFWCLFSLLLAPGGAAVAISWETTKWTVPHGKCRGWR